MYYMSYILVRNICKHKPTKTINFIVFNEFCRILEIVYINLEPPPVLRMLERLL